MIDIDGAGRGAGTGVAADAGPGDAERAEEGERDGITPGTDVVNAEGEGLGFTVGEAIGEGLGDGDREGAGVGMVEVTVGIMTPVNEGLMDGVAGQAVAKLRADNSMTIRAINRPLYLFCLILFYSPV